VRNKLQAAGLGDVTPTSFLAVKGALAGIVLVVGLLTLITGAKPPLIALGIALGGGYASLVLPDAYLGMRTRGRKEELTAQMPDVLDLLTVSVEAGLGFDAALVKVGERMEGPLIEELQLVIHEMRIGESRAKALKNFAERLDVPETTAFARSIIQADQLGIALGRILRVQAQDMRNRRQMAAEEKAMKAPVKMLVPTAIFIFPAMFVVILGPAMLSLVRMFAEL
jgi:tight adherence protein C